MCAAQYRTSGCEIAALGSLNDRFVMISSSKPDSRIEEETFLFVVTVSGGGTCECQFNRFSVVLLLTTVLKYATVSSYHVVLPFKSYYLQIPVKLEKAAYRLSLQPVTE